jgi:hypothetical protein
MNRRFRDAPHGVTRAKYREQLFLSLRPSSQSRSPNCNCSVNKAKSAMIRKPKNAACRAAALSLALIVYAVLFHIAPLFRAVFQTGTWLIADAAAQTSLNVITDFGVVSDWAPVAGSATGTGTDNTTALQTALNSCGQNGATDVYIPAGAKIYLGGTVTFGQCDTYVSGGGTLVLKNGITNLKWAPAFGPHETIAGVVTGYVLTNSNGFVPTTAGTNCEVGDILKLPLVTKSGVAVARTVRENTLLQVASCTGTAVATLNVLQAGVMQTNPGASSGTLITVSGTTSGVATTNLTWSAPPGLGPSNFRTELVLNGPNSLSADGQTITLTSDGSTIAQADKIKIVSNQQATWQYSNALRNISVVINTADRSYGPVIAAGGTGYHINNTLTLTTLASPFPRNALGEPVQAVASTAATLVVDGVTASGAITAAHVATGGIYDHISYGAIPVTGGTGSGAQFFLTYTATDSSGFAEIASIAKIVDATHIVLDRVLYQPVVFDAANPPIIAKLPSQRLVIRDIVVQASGQIHSTAISGRVPAAIRLVGAIEPVLDNVKSAGVFERFVEENSVYHGRYDLVLQDAVDQPSQGGYGYGFTSSSASIGGSVEITGYGARHTATGISYKYGYAQAATNFGDIGGSYDVLVHDSIVHGSRDSGFDVHEDAANWTFANDAVYFDTQDPNQTAGPALGLGIRGYNTTVFNFRGQGSNNCIDDDTQRFPFSGIYGRPTLTKIIGVECEQTDLALGSSANGNGIVVEGPSVDGNTWGSPDPNAVTLIKNATISNCAQAVNVGENINKVIIDDMTVIDCRQLVSFTGPVDLEITNSGFDASSAWRNPNQGQLISRTAGLHITGASSIILLNDFILNGSQATPNPTTIFASLETAAGNSTALYVAGLMEPIRHLATFVSTMGGTVTVQDAGAQPRVGPSRVKLAVLAVPLTAAGDAAIIPVAPQYARYKVVGVDITNCGTSQTTSTAGLWSGPGKTGTNLSVNQALSALTGGTFQNLPLTMTAASTTTDLTAPNLYFNVGTPQASGTADVYIYLEDKSNN